MTDIRPGYEVNLIVRWGAQQRLQCPRCQHFAKSGTKGKVFCSCGAVFMRTESGLYEVVSV